MKRRGFILIVIVILAIITIIATTIVLDKTEDSKENSNKRSIELYGDAVEQAVAKAKLNGNIVPSGKYTTEDGKTLTQGDTTLKVDYNGAKVVCDVYVSNKGTISLKSCKVNNKKVEYTYGKIEDINNKTYTNGEVVYFDVTTGEACDNYTEENSKTGYNGTNGTENQNGCMKFYAFNDDGGSKVNLLLDHNTTATVAWNSGGSNESGPKEVLEQLKIDTDAWIGTQTPENYSIDQSDQTSTAKYTVDYSEYKARLITANEIARITGNTTFDEKLSTSAYFYFDTNKSTQSDTCKSGDISGCKYSWLYDRTVTNCTEMGCLNVETYGYWTMSSDASSSNCAWDVSFGGYLSNGDIVYGHSYGHGSYGVRPVITISKAQLN